MKVRIGGFQMNKPRRIEFGDTIGIIAPSGPTDKEKVELGKEFLEKMGFKLKLGRSCYNKWGYLAGSDELRANDFNEMFSDDEVNGIICLRGGYGTQRILSMIDFNNIRKNPKVYVGYSDITGTHVAMNQISELITFHGPMVTSDMAVDFNVFSNESLFRTITNPSPIGKINNPYGEKIETLFSGNTEGKLIGGNLALLCSSIGTPYEIDTKDKILFLEDIGEEPYRVDRMLTQLKNAGKLEDANGIVLGDWNNCVPENPEKSISLMEVFEDIILPLRKPTIYNVKAGHCSPMITLPLGVDVFLDADKGELIIKEGAVL